MNLVATNPFRVYQTPPLANLIIAYDLVAPGRNYEAVQTAICSLGRWYKFQYSLFFVQAPMRPQDAYEQIRPYMDANDKLLVAHANEAFVGSYPAFDIQALQEAWLDA